MSSAKNQLQEYFQKRHLETPTYETRKVRGTAHAPGFCSAVILHDGTKFTSELFSNKKNAEKNAAAKALLYVLDMAEEEEKSEIMTFSVPDDVEIFVDMENKPEVAKKLDRYVLSDARGRINLFFFASQNHPTTRNKFSRSKIITTPTSRKDGVDIHIACELARLGDKTGPNQIIVTGDHFGHTLADIMNKYYYYSVRCASSYEEVCSILREIENQSRWNV